MPMTTSQSQVLICGNEAAQLIMKNNHAVCLLISTEGVVSADFRDIFNRIVLIASGAI